MWRQFNPSVGSVKNSNSVSTLNPSNSLFQPILPADLLKELLEFKDEEELQSNNNDESNESLSKTEDKDTNILDVSMIMDETSLEDKSITELYISPDRKPFKIFAKQTIDTPLSNSKFQNHLNVMKENIPINENEAECFKTPIYKNNVYIPSSIQGSSNSVVRKKLPDVATPQTIQNYKIDTPRLSFQKNVIDVLRKKNMNIVNKQGNDCIQTHSRETISNISKPSFEEKQLNKQTLGIISPTAGPKTFNLIKVQNKHYILINKIGTGGSSVVYRCLDQETLEDRAIKMIDLNVDPATEAGYRNEVAILKKFQGSNRVIRMYDHEIVHKKLFVVMEKGEDFLTILKNINNEEKLPIHAIIFYWREMLECVREVHRKGIIHSDLKPSNFLIVEGKLKIIDFGIASNISSEMTSIVKHVQVGTFNYISPEALLDTNELPGSNPNLKISFKSDVWSLGCILYLMIYKKTPFQHISGYAKYEVIIDSKHVIHFPEIKGVPHYLLDMAKRCLKYNMRQRPSVEDLLTMFNN